MSRAFRMGLLLALGIFICNCGQGSTNDKNPNDGSVAPPDGGSSVLPGQDGAVSDGGAAHHDGGSAAGRDAATEAADDSGTDVDQPDAASSISCGAGKTPCESICCNDTTELCDGNGTCNPNPCNAFPDTTCAAGQTCYPDWVGAGTDTCSAAGTAAIGAACTAFNQCVAGVGCYFENGVGICAKLCDPTGASCDHGQCQSVDGTYGACFCTPTDEPSDCAVGQSCYPDYFMDGSYACATTGTVAVGSACSDYHSCVAGAACIPDSTGKGSCTQLCDPDGAPCSDDKTCRSIDSTLSGCWCDPLGQTGCAGGLACYYYDGCRAAGTTATGADCTKDSQCAPGDICLPMSATESICRKICDPTGQDDCPAPTTCQSAYNEWCPRLPTPPDIDICLPST